MKAWDWGRVGVLGLLLAVGCGRPPPAQPAGATDARAARRQLGAPLPVQALQRTAYLQFAVYYRASHRDAEKLARTLLARKHSRLTVTPELPREPQAPLVSLSAPKLADYAPPSAAMLDHFGRGLAAGDRERLRAVDRVLVVELSAPPQHASFTHRSALSLVQTLADELDGYAWDELTRELFTREAFRQRTRTDQWNVADHVTTHFYRADGGPRLITLGMVKFGLPDVVLERLPATTAHAMNGVALLVCQTLLEQPRIERAGKFDVDVARLRNQELRAALQANMFGGASGRATLAVSEGLWQEGDPHNRLLEIGFPGPHESLHERQDALIAALFGSRDSIVHIRHDAEILAASERAKSELLALKARFSGEQKHSEVLLVKAPFETTTGENEWMWVEVTDWKGTTITGILQNDPFHVPNLRSGARVSFDEKDAFDYIYQRDDGSEVGNETGKIIMRREADQRRR